MSEPETVDATNGLDLVADAASLGDAVLAQIVENMPDGVLLCDADGRCVYVNPATCLMLGRPATELMGYGYEKSIPPRDLTGAREYFASVLEGSTELVTQMLVAADGVEREMVLAAFPVSIDGRPHGAALVRDFTDSRVAGRSAAALAQSAAELIGDAPTNEILSSIARHAVEGTSAMWAGLAVIGEADTFAFAGAYGPAGAEFVDSEEAQRSLQTAPAGSILEAVSGGVIRAGDVPSRAVALTRSTWERDPHLATYGRTVLQHDWQHAMCVPLAYDNRVIGAMTVLLPRGQATLDDAEVTFCTALADQAAVAVANEHLSRQAERSAELDERARVARELHDSVSQALFAMTMHARTAQLSLARTGLETDTPLAESLDQLSQLSRGTLAEMRALIFELRPEALADEGLVTALKTQAAAISARERVMVDVEGPPDRLPLAPEVEMELYRIVSESLREAVRRPGEEAVLVRVRVEEDQLTVSVAGDGGIVKPPTARDLSRLGLMADRAQSVGALLVPLGGDRHAFLIIAPLYAAEDRVGAAP